MSVILDIDLDYFGLFKHPMRELERVLGWAARPVDFVVEHYHESYLRWNRMVKNRELSSPEFIIHVDEHHDMLSEKPPVNFGSFVYFAMRRWPDCQVYWLTLQPIDYPDIWLSEDAWNSVSARFECGSSIKRHWPKPDLVSVCTSPEFLDQQLCKRLLQRISTPRTISV
jgi:hypothetical protein